jgi:cell division septation protein DedD
MSIDARDVRSTPEEGFHEIQLSGKQLVFLFMATTVVSIVIFLCGVLVGRGVRADSPAGELATRVSVGELAVDVGAPEAAGAATADVPPPVEEPTPAADDLSYPNRLSGAKPPAETLSAQPKDQAAAGGAAALRNPLPEKAGAAASRGATTATGTPPPPAPGAKASTEPATTPASTPPAAAKAAAPPAAGAAAPPLVAPASGKYTVQVAAYAQRDQAAALARQLSGRGYAAYVEPPSGKGGARMYRVRVGGYADRRDADRMRERLQQEGKYKPWVTTR